MSDADDDLPDERIVETVTLTGFYITPFGRKKQVVQGHEAVGRVEKEINFDEVVKVVEQAVTDRVYETKDYAYKLTLHRHTVRAEHLDVSIRKNIDDADFVVTDWTGSNWNVLLEAGYAEGRSKHGIHLSADRAFPTDRAGIICVSYDPENLQQLAAALPTHIRQLLQRIESGPWSFDYYATRSTELLRQMIDESRNEISILQTNLETLNANHISDLASALKRQVRVRILTLDPQSRYVNERALQLNYKDDTIRIYRNGLQNAIDNVVAQLAPLSGFKLRLYNDFPNQLTYIFDNHVLASVMSRTGRSRDNCVFHLPRHRLPGAKHTFVDHFNQLWEAGGQENPPIRSA